MSRENNIIIKILHEILDLEYKKYVKAHGLQGVYLLKEEIYYVINKFVKNKKKADEIFNYLLKNDLIIKYIGNNNKNLYRSIYFDVLEDYTNIKEKKLGKPTVFEYRIIGNNNGLIKQPIPLINIKCEDVYYNILNLLNNRMKDQIPEKFKILTNVLKYIVCLRKKYSKFQSNSIIRILNSLLKNVNNVYIITAPTGWGKTEAFIIPILVYSTFLKMVNANNSRGVKAFLIYPRKALASNQVKRLISYYIILYERIKKNLGIDPLDILPTIAIRDGQSIDQQKYKQGSDFRIKSVKIRTKDKTIKYRIKVESSSLVQAISDEGNKAILPVTNVHFETINLLPDIVVTNIDTFNRMLTCPRFSNIWKNSRYLGAIVFDEAHIYSGTYYLHLIYLLNRMYQFIRELNKIRSNNNNIQNFPTIIFSSATLYKNFEEQIRKTLPVNTLTKIDYESSKDTSKTKIIIPLIIAPHPNVAGQWIAQLISIYNALFGLSRAIKFKAIIHNKSIPYKFITFIDSLSYLRSIYSGVKTLLNRIDRIATWHYSKDKNPEDLELWSFVDDDLINYLKKNLESIKSSIIKVHYGDLPQDEREKIEESFQEKTMPILLLSTSTLELGIDIPDLWGIIQFRPPLQSDSFIQRMGRAGRKDKTFRTSVGTLILTNQPSDIAYLFDKNKQKSLFEISELRVPRNDTILAQHIFLTIFDALNLLFISGKLNPNYYDLLNSLYYKPPNNQDYKQIITQIYKAIKSNEAFIYNYIKLSFLNGYRNRNKYNYVEEDYYSTKVEKIFNLILNDLENTQSEHKLVEKIINSKFIQNIKDVTNNILNEVRKLMNILQGINLPNEIYSGNPPIFSLIDVLLKIKNRYVSNNYKEIENLCVELYDEVRDQLQGYRSRYEEIIDILNNGLKDINDKNVVSKILEAIKIMNKIINLLHDMENMISGNELLTQLISLKEQQSLIEQADNLLQYLSYSLQRGMYYTSILSLPLKHVYVKYTKDETRTEPLNIAMRRLANLTIYKPIR